MSANDKELVFVGGGHAHALVIDQLGKRPIGDTRITLISEQTLTPYSGMLPGFVAGHYSYHDAHIDLERLCNWANYDVLSIDIGSTPDLSVPGASDFATGVKPVSHFGSLWNQLLKASENTSAGQWGVVGAGAGGVELVLGMANRLKEHKQLAFHLVFSSPRVLPGYPEKVVSRAEAALSRYNVTLHAGCRRWIKASGVRELRQQIG